jgi:signal recognition particle subunit SRP54
MEAMIRSMTPSEREERVELVPSRRRRIADGSGSKVDDVNRMVKGFKRVKQFCKEMPQLKHQMEKKGGKFPFPGKMPWE